MHTLELFLLFLCAVHAINYKVTLLSKGSKPALSFGNPVGQGYSPCKYTFNPGWVPILPDAPDQTKAIVIVRAATCPASFGGSGDHLMLATCYTDGHCDDLQSVTLPFESSSQDPRIIYWKGWYYLFYYASGKGESTVYLRKSKTPGNLTSWELTGNFPWHRNGCMLLRDSGPHYCLFGEAPPLPGIGLASTDDIEKFTVLNPKYILPNGPNNPKEPEIVLEASTPVVRLSTGDYLHIYSAGTPGWVANGNYTGGWIVLDGNDPTILKQRSTEHVLMPTVPWEGTGDSQYPVQRYRTIFATSLVLVTQSSNSDIFRVWYGAADASVASALLQVTWSN